MQFVNLKRIALASLAVSMVIIVMLWWRPMLATVQRRAVLSSPLSMRWQREPDGVIVTSQSSYTRYGCPVWDIGNVRFAIVGRIESLERSTTGVHCPDYTGGKQTRVSEGRVVTSMKFTNSGILCTFYEFDFEIKSTGEVLFRGNTLSIVDQKKTCVVVNCASQESMVFALE
jgi:hypothetical protein